MMKTDNPRVSARADLKPPGGVIRILAVVTLLTVACRGAAPPDALMLRLIDGVGPVVRAGQVSPTRFSVTVTDPSGTPVPEATVTFHLPRDGAGGRFASGLSSESCLTAGDGIASISGITWNQHPGRAVIRVRASAAGRSGAMEFAVEVSPAIPGQTARALGGGSPTRKWWVLAGVAAGSLAAFAFARQGGSSQAGAVTFPAALPPPNLGQPLITIGKP